MSTFSKLRVGPKRASAGVPTLNLAFTFDATQANTTGTGYILPAGAVVTGGVSVGNGTGGVGSNTFDMGLSGGAVDALVAEGDADSATNTAIAITGAGLYAAPLTADTEITAGAGATASTGGTVSVYLEYYIHDSRNGANG